VKTLKELDAERIKRDITPFKGRELNPSKPVRVYRNLGRHSKQPWSIMQGKYVIGHATNLMLADCKPVIFEKRRQRILRTGLKTVHAFIEGMVIGSGMGTESTRTGRFGLSVHYDPKINSTFIYSDGKEFKGAWVMRFQGTTVEAVYCN